MRLAAREAAAPARAWVDVLDAAFFETYFERRPFLARGAHGGRLADIVSVRALEYLLISPPGARHSYVRLGKVLGDGRWDIAKLETDFTVAKLVRGYRDGYSILVDEVNYRWAPIAAQCAALQERFARHAGVIARNRATCGLFLTPPRAQGSAPHYDCKDVFVLQIAGAKTWRLHAPPVEAPLRNSAEGDVDLARIGEPVLEATLEPGDLLYLPRGFVHAPLTRDAGSLHLSFGIATLTWSDVLLPMLEARAAFRRSVPTAALTHAGDADLRETVASLIASLDDAPEAARRFRLTALANLVGETQVAAGLLADATATPRELADDLVLEKRYGARWLIDRAGQELAIAFPGKLVGVPLASAPAIERIVSSDRVTVGDVGCDLAQRLLDAGFLSIARPNDA